MQFFEDLPPSYRKLLANVPRSPHAAADTAACLLGRDLWFAPLAGFRDRLVQSGERPHLWTFPFAPSGRWDATLWNSLSLTARQVRARTGAVERLVVAHVSAWSLQMEKRQVTNGLSELLDYGLARADGRGYAFNAIAAPRELSVDLSLVEILAHWLWMLDHHDRILDDPHATGFDVHGYAEACSDCRHRWGMRPREAQWVPPFHPGCRCFAQPRFTQSQVWKEPGEGKSP